MPQALTNNAEMLTPAELTLCRSLCLEAGQAHLFERWPAPGTDDDGKRALVDQLVELDQQYPGGLLQYHSNAVSLLADSKAGVNPFDGLVPSVPVGVDLGFDTEGFRAAENTGVAGVGDVGFVLVAGGLGERLGFGGIKVQLPTEILTGRCYLGLFCEHILALQKRMFIQRPTGTPITRVHKSELPSSACRLQVPGAELATKVLSCHSPS